MEPSLLIIIIRDVSKGKIGGFLDSTIVFDLDSLMETGSIEVDDLAELPFQGQTVQFFLEQVVLRALKIVLLLEDALIETDLLIESKVSFVVALDVISRGGSVEFEKMHGGLIIIFLPGGDDPLGCIREGDDPKVDDGPWHSTQIQNCLQ